MIRAVVYRTPRTVDSEESIDPSPKENNMPDPAVPQPPYANKAIAAAVGFVIAFVVQWLTSKGITLDQEGVTAIAGVLTTLAVYAVSNFKKLGS